MTEQPHRIVQQWRTLDFPVDGGTRVTFRHSQIAAGQGAKYEQGWIDHYLEPMKKHFS